MSVAKHEAFSITAKEIAGDPDLVAFAPEIHEPSKEEFNRLRPELYALLAITVDKVFGDAFSARDTLPPFGLEDEHGGTITTISDFSQLNQAFWTTLHNKIEPAFTAMQASPLAPAIDRLGEVTALFHQSYEGFRYESSETLVNHGVGTAADELGRSLKAVARVVRKVHTRATPEDISQVALNSQALLRRVASVNLAHLSSVTAVVGDAEKDLKPPYDYHTHGLALKVDASGKEYVDFIKPVIQTDDPYAGHVSRAIGERHAYFNTLGCPALVKFEGESVVDKLWEWAVTVATAAKLFDNPELYE